MKSVSLSHTYYELLFSLSDTHSCSFLWQNCSCRSCSVPRLFVWSSYLCVFSLCIMQDHIKSIKNSHFLSPCLFSSYCFLLYRQFPFQFSQLNNSHPLILSSTSRKYCLFTPSIKSFLIINTSLFSLSFCALVTHLILITNAHFCFCWIVRSLEQSSCLLTCLSGMYHAQAWSTVVRLLLYEYLKLHI